MNAMKSMIPLLAAALLLAACKKTNGPDYPWQINLTDGSGSYRFVGRSQKEAQTNDRAFFASKATYSRKANGQLQAFTSAALFATHNGNPQEMSMWLGLFSGDTALLPRIDPQTNTATARLTALRQWLEGRTLDAVTGSYNTVLARYHDASGRTWQQDSLSTATVTFSNVAPSQVTGYGNCLKADLRFTLGLAQYANTLPLNLLGRQSISGSITAFFTLDE
jgi:hypothetical protein